LIDSDEGMTIEACARISRALGNQMDEMDFFGDSPFNLEVSSPGVDFPLTQPRQFARNVGRLVKVQLDGGLILIGKLETVDEQGIVIDVPPAKMSKTKRKTLTELPPEGIQTIPYGSIQKATVEIQF
jgi:ribosome maturation factor RimP